MRRPLILFRVRVLAFFFALASVVSADLIAQASGFQRLSLEHYLDMESVSGPQISPNGSQIVYSRSWIDRNKDRRASSLWIMNVDGTGISSRGVAPVGLRMEPVSFSLAKTKTEALRSLSDGWMLKVRLVRSHV